MLEILDKQKIEKLKKQIVSDFTREVTNVDVELPYQFTKPEKVGKLTYKTSSPVIVLNGKIYPRDIFWSYGVYNDDIVAFLAGGFSSLGTLYRTSEDEWVAGIKVEKSNNESLENCSTFVNFELDLKNNKYKILDERFLSKKEADKQMGE